MHGVTKEVTLNVEGPSPEIFDLSGDRRVEATATTTGVRKSDRMRGFQISQSEIDDHIAFLQSLTDEDFLTNPAFSNPHIK